MRFLSSCESGCCCDSCCGNTVEGADGDSGDEGDGDGEDEDDGGM